MTRLVIVAMLVLTSCVVGETDRVTPTPTTSSYCCKHCENSKPCGDSCIDSSKSCSKTGGCACYITTDGDVLFDVDFDMVSQDSEHPMNRP